MSKAYGTKYVCFTCTAKFYDMGRPEVICPLCDADQNRRPKRKEKKIFRNYEKDDSPMNNEKTNGKNHNDAVLEKMDTSLLDKEINEEVSIQIGDEEE